MSKKYIYFRADATVGNDDDAAAGSNVYSLDSFRGMESTGDSEITLFFEGKHNLFSSGHDDRNSSDDPVTPAFGKTDRVPIALTTANTHKQAMKEVANAFAKAKGAFLVVGDDLDSEYLASGIASVSNATVQIDHA